MKTKLLSSITLAGLLLSAAAVSGTALADQPRHEVRQMQGHHDSHFVKVVHHRHRHHHHHRHHGPHR